MKKTAIVLTLLILSVVLLFTGCGKSDMDNKVTTTNPVTTTTPATTTAPVTENNSLLTDELTTKNGTLESTSRDSALGDLVEGAAEGAADVNEKMADANEKIADGVRNAENKLDR